jgi:hypothetical protein
MVGERPKPFGEAFGFDPITSTLIFGEYDAVLVDASRTSRMVRPVIGDRPCAVLSSSCAKGHDT